jgi:hypothetical protein
MNKYFRSGLQKKGRFYATPPVFDFRLASPPKDCINTKPINLLSKKEGPYGSSFFIQTRLLNSIAFTS